MMKSVRFDYYDTARDFALILATYTIGEAPARTNTVEVEGMDGVLDFTEYFGEIFYENRELEFTFSLIEPMADFPRIYSEVKNAINGKRMKITPSWDSGFYYVGRVTVNEWESDGRVGTIVIGCDCEPYKYRQQPTKKTLTVNGAKKCILRNLRKRVSPSFEFDASMTVKFKDASYTASAGSWSDPRIILLQGENEMTFEGTGTVTITYQERGL